MNVVETKTEAVQILNLWPLYAKSTLIQIYGNVCQNWENLSKSCLNLRNLLLFIK